jgi:hypothetical protein
MRRIQAGYAGSDMLLMWNSCRLQMDWNGVRFPKRKLTGSRESRSIRASYLADLAFGSRTQKQTPRQAEAAGV